MTGTLKDKTDIKIFVLYLLMHIERPVDMITLNDIVVQDGFVNQFDFMDCLYELCESKNIDKSKGADGTELYSVTAKGRAVADTLESSIVGSIKDRSLRSALRLLSFERRGSVATSEVIPTENGKFVFNCSIKDAEGVSMNCSLTLDTKRQAYMMKMNFDERPEFIYKGILSLFSGDVNYLAESWSDDIK